MSAMLLLGLILFGAAGAFAGLLLMQNSADGSDYAVSLFGFDLGRLSTPQAFLAGIALTLVFAIGLALAIGSRLRARHLHAARLAAEREAIRIRAERDEYAARLGIPVSHAPDIDLDETAPLAPSIFPWANPW
jgi:hypothetical protein